MTQKVNGAAYQGIWVEKQVAFVKLVFSKDISALAATDLYVLGTTTAAGAGTVADSTFGVVESALVQALKILETKSTVLGVSKYDSSSYSVDVMLGFAQGWISDVNGIISTGNAVSNAEAVVTTAGAAPTNVLGALVTVKPSAVTFDMKFAAFDGKMSVATYGNGDLDLWADGNGPGTATNPMGSSGYYPTELASA
jgi:hypothetical protein